MKKRRQIPENRAVGFEEWETQNRAYAVTGDQSPLASRAWGIQRAQVTLSLHAPSRWSL